MFDTLYVTRRQSIHPLLDVRAFVPGFSPGPSTPTHCLCIPLRDYSVSDRTQSYNARAYQPKGSVTTAAVLQHATYQVNLPACRAG